jgi:hypothetical protein
MFCRFETFYLSIYDRVFPELPNLVYIGSADSDESVEAFQTYLAVGACNRSGVCSQTAGFLLTLSATGGWHPARIICQRARHHPGLLAIGHGCSHYPLRADAKGGFIARAGSSHFSVSNRPFREGAIGNIFWENGYFPTVRCALRPSAVSLNLPKRDGAVSLAPRASISIYRTGGCFYDVLDSGEAPIWMLACRGRANRGKQ